MMTSVQVIFHSVHILFQLVPFLSEGFQFLVLHFREMFNSLEDLVSLIESGLPNI